ncbi:MAG: hypothetical protein ABIH39_02190 [Candidatus Margulisiibacteriota bacterium]
MSSYFEETYIIEQQIDDALNEYSFFEENNYKRFEQELSENLHPDMTVEEQAAQVVLTAVQLEFGPEIISNTKMINMLKEAVLLDRETKEEIAAVAENLVKTGKITVEKPVN